MRRLADLVVGAACGVANANIDFDELRRLLTHLGFVERVGGSRHVFVRAGVEDLFNLQREGRLAKPYQLDRQKRYFRLRPCGQGGRKDALLGFAPKGGEFPLAPVGQFFAQKWPVLPRPLADASDGPPYRQAAGINRCTEKD